VRTLLINLALVLGSLILASSLAELGLRITHYGEANRTPLQKLMEYDALLGWRHKRNVSSEIVSVEYRTNVQYNAEGWRGLDLAFDKPADVFRILVLGDSFVDAYTIPVQDRFSEVLETRLGSQFEVINLGVGGYSTDQELLLLEQEGWKYQPDLVVLAFYYNDVWGNGSPYFSNSPGVQKPVFVADATGNLSLRNIPVPFPTISFRERFRLYDLVRTAMKSNRWLRNAVIRSGLASGAAPDNLLPSPTGAAGGAEEFAVYHSTESPELAREWSITQTLLRRMHEEAKQHHAQLLILYVPTRIELSPSEWSSAHLPPDYAPGVVVHRLIKICEAEGITYLDPEDRFRAVGANRLYYTRDPHWNAAGHHLAGEILADYIRSCSPRDVSLSQCGSDSPTLAAR
jgi:hypothetical protein